MVKTRPAQAGFTLVEMLIGLLVGSIAMTMFFRMFITSTEAIRFSNSQAMAVGEIEAAMQGLVREIKEANTTNPSASTGLPALIDSSQLALPYLRYEPPPYSAFTGAVVFPAVPAARNFQEQQTALPLYQSQWCPNPDMPVVPPDSSNSLVYFLYDGTQLHRVTIRLDSGDLVRLDQFPVTSASSSESSPGPRRRVMMRTVKSVQFTYPKLLSEINGPNGATLGSQLTSMTEPDRTIWLNQNYRKLIGIRLRVAVKGPGSGRAAITELRSTVQVRN